MSKRSNRQLAKRKNRQAEVQAKKAHPYTRTAILARRDVNYLDELLLDEQGRLRIVPSSVYEGLNWDELRLWMHHRAVYGLPTTELIEYLTGLIGDRTAIEIGAGNGCFGRALDIPMTDSFTQRDPEVAFLYQIQGQPTVDYGSDVEKLEALEAVKKYRPQVVFGSWVTQWSPGPHHPGSAWGIREDQLLELVETYIVFGSIRNHGTKDICARPHHVATNDPTSPEVPWMWSRAKDTALYIWERSGKTAAT